MRKLLLTTVAILTAVAMNAQSDVTVELSSSRAAKMSNGLLSIEIGSNARITYMKPEKYPSSLLAGNGVYFDYNTTEAHGFSPSTAKIVKQNADYAEVLYSSTSGDVLFQQGFIMRKGVSGVYTYVIATGTSTSAVTPVREARVCTRLNQAFLNGYVDDQMNGTMPTTAVMAEVDGNPVQDATYQLPDGSIYTKYDWAQYITCDSLHGLMLKTNIVGVWNIHCATEWYNGGPMRQELTTHATNTSPITIQMFQGEHFGASALTLKNGEQKLYGPFLIYVNMSMTKDSLELINDAKQVAHEHQQAWPFEWFDNALYPHDRATVKGRLNVTTGQARDSVMMLLAQPGEEPYRQTSGYQFWAMTDKDGNFEIKHVRKGDYMLYAYATKGDVTDELQRADIHVDSEEVDLGTIDWTPTCYETKLWQIGENNRMSSEFNRALLPRAYGLWNETPSTLTYTIGTSTPEKNWYFAQVQNGMWTVAFNLDEVPSGNVYLTASVAGATSTPKVAVSINGTTRTTWSFDYNDAAIYRSARQSGRHSLWNYAFPASYLKKGRNTISFTKSGNSHGGVQWDCIKLETGNKVVNGIATLSTSDDLTKPVKIYTIDGKFVGTYQHFGDAPLSPGLYIYRQGNNSGKVLR